MLRIYELKNGDGIKIDNEVYIFKRMDGAYSICVSKDGVVINLAGYAPLIKVGDYYEIDDSNA